MEVPFLNPLFFIPAGVALAISICAVAERLLRLIPQGEATGNGYRSFRLCIVLAAAVLVLVVLTGAVILYLVISFGGTLLTPV